MKVDFQKGVSIQIGGELGKYSTLPVEYLIEIVKNLQKLITNIAIADIRETSAIDLNAFKIELAGFRHGSAVPQFVFTPRVQNVITGDLIKQRKVVSERFEKLLSLSKNNDYSSVVDLYPDSQRRNDIVRDWFDFSNSFGESPVAFVKFNEDQSISSLYAVKRMSATNRDALTTQIIPILQELPVEETVFGRIRKTTKSGSKKPKIKYKVMDTYSDKTVSLSFAPDVIAVEQKTYFLKFPLRCLIEKIESEYIIKCEMLDLVVSGESETAAEEKFCREFDTIYTYFNATADHELPPQSVNIRNLLNILIIDRIE